MSFFFTGRERQLGTVSIYPIFLQLLYHRPVGRWVGRRTRPSDILVFIQVVPGFEPGLLDSKSRVLTNWTIQPETSVGRVSIIISFEL